MIGRLVRDRNGTGGGKFFEDGSGKRQERAGERETNETSWCVSSEVVAVAGK